ncbi:MAG: SirB2 family protein [Betaproteobacteria bacterium]|nr:SirB2 family protein [Betaproteobacteria bacterium]
MSYLALKNVHVACVILSYAFFFVRGVWMIRESQLLARRWVKIMPHVIDTVLLVSAIALAVMIRQYPFVDPWLTAKVLGLVVYIGLGMIALRRGRTRRARVTAWTAAQAVFLYIVAVALTRSALPGLN